MSLYEEGELQPTAAQIAERAGVAVRSVYGHFGDIESLAAEVVRRQWQRCTATSPDCRRSPARCAERVERAARPARRALRSDRAGAPRRRCSTCTAARRSPPTSRSSPSSARAQVAETFAPELGRCGTEVSAVLDAADLLARRGSRGSACARSRAARRARARRVLANALTRLLESDQGVTDVTDVSSIRPEPAIAVRRARVERRRRSGRDAQPPQVQGAGRGRSGIGRRRVPRYGDAAVKMVEEQGGRVLWQGRADQILIGDPEQDWDSVVLVEYPSRKAFIDMVTTPKYEAAHEHREAGSRAHGARRDDRAVPRAIWRADAMGRKILFITTDQQRYDSLGCNGGTIARTPVVDGLAATGIDYRRAYNQNTVCMPARSTMLTGQYVRTHGVFANGIPLPDDAPSVAAYLKEHAGYRTALLGKAHFDPGFDLDGTWRGEPAARARAAPDRCAASTTSSSRCTRRTSVSVRSSTTASGSSTTHGLEACAGFSPLLAARARRRHRRAGDEHQPDPARVVPHRLGRRPHDRVPRLAARRRRLVRVDVVPRPAPPVGPAGVGDRTRRLARPRPAARSPRLARARSPRCSRRSPRTGSRVTRARG